MPLGLEAVCMFILCQQEPSKVLRNQAVFIGSDSCRAELAGAGAEFSLALDRKQNAFAEVRKINGISTLLVIHYDNEKDKCGTVRDIVVAPNPAYVFEFECNDHVDKNRVVVGVRAEELADANHWKALNAWVVDFEKLKVFPTTDPVTCLNFDYSGQDDGSDVKTRAARRARAPAQQKLDVLLVYGENFTFSVKEPTRWTGDTTNAEKFESNAVLHEAGQPLDSISGLIRIRVSTKVDENTRADLEEDMRSYKAQYPKVQFKDIRTTNPTYLCLAKVFYIPGEFYEYVAYVNPGSQEPVLFSVSMNTQKSEASAKELEAFKSTIHSLTLLKP